MNNNVKVTIFCYAYNHAKYIDKALDSFVNQITNFSYEIVIHDDCSNDGTQKIIEEYHLKYPNIIKPIYETENKYSKNHNIFIEFCLPIAKGKYIAFCEGDDYWTDNYKLQKQYDALENNPSALMCCHKTKCSNEDDSFNKTIYPSKKLKMNNSYLLKKDDINKLFFSDIGFFFHFSSYFINKEAFNDNSIYYKFNNNCNEDTKMFYTIASSSDIYYISDIMSNRRLLTIDNWNNRFKKLSLHEKINYSKKDIETRYLYNELTNYKYQEFINYSVYNDLLKIYEKYNVKLNLNYLNKYKIKFPFFYSLKFDIKYLLFSISPKLYNYVIKKIRSN